MALFKSSNLRFDYFAKMVRDMLCVTYDGPVDRRSRGGDRRGQEGKKHDNGCEMVNNNVALPHTQ